MADKQLNAPRSCSMILSVDEYDSPHWPVVLLSAPFLHCLRPAQRVLPGHVGPTSSGVTMTLALPIWCLYLPFVIALKDAEEWRIWIILFSGILIGPASLASWGLILQLARR